MQQPRRRNVTVALVLAVLVALPQGAGAQENGPRVTSVEVSPDTIDVSDGGAVVTVRASVESTHGVDHIFPYFVFGEDYGYYRYASAPPALVEGDQFDGVWEWRTGFPQYLRGGTWYLGIQASDAGGDSFFGSPAVEVVDTNPDMSSPVVRGLTISPQEVDVSQGAATVDVWLDIDDDLAGTETVQVWLTSDAHWAWAFDARMQRLAGDERSGSWYGAVAIPSTAPRGDWDINVTVADHVGNRTWLYRSDLEAAGFPSHVKVGPASVPHPPDYVWAEARDQAALVHWYPAADGGSTLTGYTVVANPGGRAVTVAPDVTNVVVDGLENNQRYTFTVYATNAVGDGPASGPSNVVRPYSVEGDTTPPSVHALRLDPQSVDVTERSEHVTFSVDASDAESGPSVACAYLASPSGQDFLGECTSFPEAEDGQVEGRIQVPQWVEPGAWTVELYVYDRAWNASAMSTEDLRAAGLPAELLVTSNPDDDPPTITGLDFTPRAVDVRERPADINVSVTANDDLSGVSMACVEFLAPDASHAVAECLYPGADGGMTGTLTVEQWVSSGTWTASAWVYDHAGNQAFLATEDLAAAGLPTELQVTSSKDEDVPELSAFTFTPHSFPASSPQRRVTFDASATDATSGVASICFNFMNDEGWSAGGIMCFPPDTDYDPYYDVYNDRPPGIYRAQVWVVDKAHHNRYYGWEELRELGFDHEFMIESDEAPTAPQGVRAARGPGLQDVTVAWDAPAETGTGTLTGYQVLRDGQPIGSVAADQTHFVDEMVAPGTHTYTVVALSTVGESLASAPATISVLAVGTPSGPTGFSAEGGNGEVALRWGPPASDGNTPVTGYVLQRDGQLVGELAADATSFVDSGLGEGERVTYTLAAMNAVGVGPSAGPVTATTFARPGAPVDAAAAPGEAVGEVAITWSPPVSDGGSQLLGFRIYRDGALLDVVGGTTYRFVDSGRQPLQGAEYVVEALNEVGVGPQADAGCAMPYPWVVTAATPACLA